MATRIIIHSGAAEAEPVVYVRINGVEHTVLTDVETSVEDDVLALLQASRFADDMEIIQPKRLLVQAGQSNGIAPFAYGATALPAGWSDTARIQMWDNATNTFGTYSPSALTNWGPEVGYAKAWLDANSGNSDVLYIVKHNVGSTAIVDWSPPAGTYYAQLMAELVPARAALGAHTVEAFLWWQGEQDAAPGSAALGFYPARARTLYADMRSVLGDADMPIVTHAISSQWTGYDFAGMLRAQRAVARDSAHNYIVDTRGLASGDGVHFTAVSIAAIGAAAYGLVYGRTALTAPTLDGKTVLASAAAETVVGTLSCAHRDGRDDIVWSLVSPESNFELAGSTVRVKRGAALVAGTEEITVMATSPATGVSIDATISISIVADWWLPNAIIDVDYEHDRAYVNSVAYASVAAARTAGAIVQTGGVDRIATGTLPSAYTVVAKGITSSAQQGATSAYLIALDDGADAAPADELLYFARQLVSNQDALQVAVFDNSATQLPSDYASSGQAGRLYPVRIAARVKANDVAFSFNGGAVITDTSVTLPTFTQLVVGNRDDAARPWGGTISRVAVTSTDTTNANLPGVLG